MQATRLEVIVAGCAVPEGYIRPGDHVLVDWSLKPGKGAIGALRMPNGVQFARFDGDQSVAIGRLVNPSRLLRVPAP